MSILWALTGSTDIRPVQDGKVGDVVHTSAKVREGPLNVLVKFECD